MPVIQVWGRQRPEDPWSSLANRPRVVNELQVQWEILSAKRRSVRTLTSYLTHLHLHIQTWMDNTYTGG